MDEEGQRCPKFGAEELGLDPWGTGKPREVLNKSVSSKIFKELVLKPKGGAP